MLASRSDDLSENAVVLPLHSLIDGEVLAAECLQNVEIFLLLRVEVADGNRKDLLLAPRVLIKLHSCDSDALLALRDVSRRIETETRLGQVDKTLVLESPQLQLFRLRWLLNRCKVVAVRALIELKATLMLL